MCCLVALASLIGPRLGMLVWWLFDMDRWARAFGSVAWPVLGVIFAPWTTLAWVVVYTGGVHGIEWVLIALGIIFDLGSLSGGNRSRRRRRRER
jgi:hypothetical protein